MSKQVSAALVGLLAGAALAVDGARAQIGPIELVVAESAFDSADFKQVTADCPPGTIAFSGGPGLNGDQGLPVIVHQSVPLGDPPTSWLVLAQEQTSTAESWSVSSRVLCATVGGYELMEDVSPVDSTNFKSAVAECPPGKTPIGGGGGIFIFTPDLALSQLQPTADGWTIQAHESSSVAGNWFVTVRVSCAPGLDLHRFRAQTQNFDEDRDNVFLRCPAGWTSLAAGGAVGGNASGALYGLSPLAELGGVSAWNIGGRRLSGSNWDVNSHLICQSPVVFADGFESGDAGAWSGMVP